MAKAWYVVHTYSGYENKAMRALMDRIKLYSLEERFGQVLVPTEDVVEVKNGQKRTTSRKFFPGYILVEMELDNQTWHLVKETPKITGFVGGEFGRKPIQMPEAEVQRITKRQAAEEEKPKVVLSFERGEEVRVIDGPLAPVSGKVDAVNTERGRIRVIVNIFGRPTPVELEFHQVEKAA
jgi:transcription termination/antitermination protein NusG